jgi:CubicO group peptidase (beta-lactamase class C family)
VATKLVTPRRTRRWSRWLLLVGFGTVFVFLGVAVVGVGVYVWAKSSLDSSTMARAMIWRDADVADKERFPARPIPSGSVVSPLPTSNRPVTRPPSIERNDKPFEQFLEESGTLAFLVVDDDELVYERYFEGTGQQDLLTSFSVAKSFVSTLLGIAIDQGKIRSIEDQVTDYVPELGERDARFQRIRLRHLLTMSSGIRYRESDLPWRLGDDTKTYYGINLREVALEETKIERPPGESWLYNNFHPLLLGLVLERATGMSVSDFMAVNLWQPLGAEQAATWSLDSKKSGFEKMESGINATASDYARFGLLLLHKGELNGRRIVSEGWVRAATALDTTTDTADNYQFFWWIDTERPGRFYAAGNLGQYIYVAPDTGTVIVRLGSERGTTTSNWRSIFRDFADQLGPSKR